MVASGSPARPIEAVVRESVAAGRVSVKVADMGRMQAAESA